MPSGFPQGCFLGMFLFTIKFNGACLRPLIERPITSNKSKSVKFVDDISIGGVINLKKSLIQDQNTPSPPNFNERTVHKILAQHDILQYELNNLLAFNERNDIVINCKKCESIMFNFSRNLTFPPNLTIGPYEVLPEVKVVRLFGVMIQ